jgi:hypothetical protein
MRAEALLEAPWGAAALRFLADPEPALEDEALPATFRGLAPAFAARPALRARFVEALCGLPEAEDHFAEPASRLLLSADLLRLVAHAAAWLDAEDLSRLLLRAEVEAARAELGPEALEFGQRRCALLPRPDASLRGALGEGPRLLRAARLLGLALAPLDPALRRRLALRRPAELFGAAAAVAAQRRPEAPAAFSALRRLLREVSPEWHGWLR